MGGLSANRGGPGAESPRRASTRSAAERRGAKRPTSRPQVSGGLVEDAVVLRLGCVGERAARFEIETEAPSPVEVVGEKVVTVPVGGSYSVVVLGPEGFRVELSGSRDGWAAGVDVMARHTEDGADLELRNDGAHEINLHLRSRTPAGEEQHVRVAAGGAQPLRWPTTRGGYDLEITTPDDETFHRRITTHPQPTPD
ncbi:phospholipase domain-containing protein [Saccharopolyspora griseoalba]|uniref:Phospholipase domain-containing protein n=1 Tax=Saccharopolyspora griseoalba TaxID=1431848 RepID=A0ABW2LDS6_9PSEU